jgi:hypothetical protein
MENKYSYYVACFLYVRVCVCVCVCMYTKIKLFVCTSKMCLYRILEPHFA